jgi:hypothetical protein
MHGFEWKNQRGVEGVGFVRALRTLLTSNLPNIIPNLKSAIQVQLGKELDHNKLPNGKWNAHLLHEFSI